MTGLLACPICRSNLERFPQAERSTLASCPDCDTQFAPYIELKQNAEKYHDLAADCLARNDLVTARIILDSLSRLISDEELPLAAVRFRLALASGDLDAAEQELEEITEPQQQALSNQLAAARETRQLAREQYNYALTSARNEQLLVAQSHIRQATDLTPGDPQTWTLKLKIDLKARDFPACYLDLEALDKLGYRPAQFAKLESLLPPL